HQKSPKSGIHVAALRVAIDVAEEEQKRREHQSNCCDNARQCQGGQCRVVFQLRWKDLTVAREAPGVHDVRNHLREDEKQDYDRHQPARDELEFIPKAEVLPFAAEADEPHPFVEGIAGALCVVGHDLCSLSFFELYPFSAYLSCSCHPVALAWRAFSISITAPAMSAGMAHHSPKLNCRIILGAPVGWPTHSKMRQT